MQNNIKETVQSVVQHCSECNGKISLHNDPKFLTKTIVCSCGKQWEMPFSFTLDQEGYQKRLKLFEIINTPSFREDCLQKVNNKQDEERKQQKIQETKRIKSNAIASLEL